jgi:hypothetical protein
MQQEDMQIADTYYEYVKVSVDAYIKRREQHHAPSSSHAPSVDAIQNWAQSLHQYTGRRFQSANSIELGDF